MSRFSDREGFYFGTVEARYGKTWKRFKGENSVSQSLGEEYNGE
jgi:hypothetical protein